MITQRIRVVAAGIEIVARLNDSTTAEALWVALPITSQVETWGDEIYFSIPVEAPEAADAQDTVEQGAVAYWPPGTALCLFWGPTPMSRGDEIRPASAVNVVGRVEGDPATLARIPAGTAVRVEAAPAR